ncbi:MAG: CDP-diacylglycerol--glycerol-3-phosphate 3-phosphatidyltransferase [Clostridia bacterium]|jgi:CDP-diacylglycerol--glycerol-3-phosphate 3-phosphatidyltransferase|nr:CDP-diacylglycerol--glycerol-3-phosphate 3-phosphatidyltransferase [Clostridia bacterium]
MNLANRLTVIRILLVPIFMVFLLTRIPGGRFWATVVFIIAAITDGLDGYIARSRQQITKLGRLIDPLADKLLISAALVSLVELSLVPAWVAVLIISREFAVTGLRTIAASEGVLIGASALGRAKTVGQVVAIILLLVQELPWPFLPLLAKVGLGVAVVLTIVSGADYFAKSLRVFGLYK